MSSPDDAMAMVDVASSRLEKLAEARTAIEPTRASDGMSAHIEEIERRMIDVRMKAKGVKRRHGLDFMVVDYLQLMEGDGDSRNTQIEGITRGMKALAKELDIAVILLSQLNRKLEERPDKRPKPSDLRDSGSIEQDADAVVLLYRDEVYNPDTRDVGICEIDVALCRQGKPGRVALTYEGEYTRFKSMDGAWSGPAKLDEKRRGRGLADSL